MKIRTAANEPVCVSTLCLVMVMASLDTSIVHTALPALSHAFGLSFRQAQAIVLTYLLAMTLLAVGAGRLGDVLGRRRVLLAGLMLFISASLACACAASIGMLLTARALQGAGAAVMVSLTVAFIADVVPGAGRGRAMGLLGSMSAAGTTLGPALGGAVLMLGGWPAIFLVNVPLGLAALMLAYRFLPPDTVRASDPCRQSAMTLLRERGMSACLANTVLVSMVLMSTLVAGPFYLARVLEINAAGAGLVLAAGPLVAALAGVPAGVLVDRFGAARLVAWSVAGIGAGCAALVFMPADLAAYMGAIAVITASYALFQAANNTLLMATVGPERRGTAAGLMGLARNGGLMAGTAVMGAVFASGWSGISVSAAPAAAVAHGMRTTFGLAFALMLLALAITRFRPDARP